MNQTDNTHTVGKLHGVDDVEVFSMFQNKHSSNITVNVSRDSVSRAMEELENLGYHVFSCEDLIDNCIYEEEGEIEKFTRIKAEASWME